MTFSFNPYAVFALRTFNRVFKESFLFRKYNAQMLDIFHRAPSYGVVLVALECHLSSLHVLCLHRRYTALNKYFTLADSQDYQSFDFFLFLDLGFTALSKIFYLHRADPSSKVGETGEPGENQQTICKQNGFPYCDLSKARITAVRKLMY